MKRFIVQIPKFLGSNFSVLSKKLTLFALSSFIGIGTGVAQDGETIFKQSCGMCHSIGKGRLVGPDLKGVTTKRSEEWLSKFIKSSQSFIKEGDQDAKAIFDEFQVVMPDQNLSQDEIKSILTFIGSKSDEKPTENVEAPKAIALTTELILKGKKYFEGSQPFVNGGASCISCHNLDYDGIIPGGMLAKDLTKAHSRLGGDDGIKGILNAPPFPAMTSAYKNNPLTEEEITSLTGFLMLVDKDKVHRHAKDSSGLLFGGFIGLCIIITLIMILWNNKKRKMVKQEIYDRQRGAI
ncbi:MAG: c-type cytochrome [Bacteroidia bacterium]|nr:c-type cytochrome [Bacteroidia bacterium]